VPEVDAHPPATAAAATNAIFQHQSRALCMQAFYRPLDARAAVMRRRRGAAPRMEPESHSLIAGRRFASPRCSLRGRVERYWNEDDANYLKSMTLRRSNLDNAADLQPE
jgi:hypothetical protein